MEKVLDIVEAAYRTLGENLVTIIFTLAAIAVLLIATPGHTMGSHIPTATEQLQMQSALSNTVTDSHKSVCNTPINTKVKDPCPIKTPGQIVQDALNTQLKGAP